MKETQKEGFNECDIRTYFFQIIHNTCRVWMKKEERQYIAIAMNNSENVYSIPIQLGKTSKELS